MTELKEIDMQGNMKVLKDVHVTSSIIPKSSSELQQNLTLDSNVIIEGAVYTNTLEISNGPAQFKKAVFANNEVHIKNDCTGSIYFMKAVASSQSVVALLSSSKCIFGSDINAPSVKLSNCFVAGSVYGTQVQLENCVVLGGVFSSKVLTIQNCIVGTFNSPEVNAGGVDYLLYPTAFSVEPISLLPGTQFWNLSLADLGSLFKGEAQKSNTGKILIDMQHDTQRTVLVDDNGTQTLVNSYSVASRVLISDILDLEKLENHFIIIGASLANQMLKQYTLTKEDGTKAKELTIINIANFFFSILQSKIEVREISDKVSFDSLKKMQ